MPSIKHIAMAAAVASTSIPVPGNALHDVDARLHLAIIEEVATATIRRERFAISILRTFACQNRSTDIVRSQPLCAAGDQ